jgi:hypothetical protein
MRPRASADRADGHRRTNGSSIPGGIFGTEQQFYETHSGGDAFLDRLEAAELRDNAMRGGTAEEQRRANSDARQAIAHAAHGSNMIFGDDSPPAHSRGASAFQTTNQVQQEQTRQMHEKALERQEDQVLMQIMVQDHGMSVREARHEIDLYRREQAQEGQGRSKAPPPQKQRGLQPNGHIANAHIAHAQQQQYHHGPPHHHQLQRQQQQQQRQVMGRPQQQHFQPPPPQAAPLVDYTHQQREPPPAQQQRFPPPAQQQRFPPPSQPQSRSPQQNFQAPGQNSQQQQRQHQQANNLFHTPSPLTPDNAEDAFGIVRRPRNEFGAKFPVNPHYNSPSDVAAGAQISPTHGSMPRALDGAGRVNHSSVEGGLFAPGVWS